MCFLVISAPCQFAFHDQVIAFMLHRPTYLPTVIFTVALLLLIPLPAIAVGASEQQQLVDDATATFQRFLETPGIASWYRTEARDVKAIFIVPRLFRGAFLAGAAGGRGVLLARDFLKGKWSPPAFYTMSAGSFGPQVGADSSEVVFVIQTFSGLERFYGSGTVKLGLDAGITLGMLGEGGTTGLDIVSFSWSKGLFAGMSVEGLAITTAESDNTAYYDAPVKPEEILSNGSLTNSGADELRATVGRLLLRNP
jgi:lipid-binding SYLF domain-containing protein